MRPFRQPTTAFGPPAGLDFSRYLEHGCLNGGSEEITFNLLDLGGDHTGAVTFADDTTMERAPADRGSPGDSGPWWESSSDRLVARLTERP